MKRLSVLLGIILMASVFAVGCTKVANTPIENKPQAKAVIHIAGLQGPTSIGMIKMFEEKPSLGANLQSDYQIIKTPDILVSKLISKEIDIATVPTNLAAKIYNKGIDYKLAAMNTWGVLYLVGSEKNIKSWKALKGKTIYSVGKGTIPDIAARYLLDKNGLAPEKDVTINYTLAQVELAQAIIAGKVKLAILPEPFVTMVSTKNPQVKIIFDIQKEWDKASGSTGAFAQTCLLVKGQLGDKNSAVVDKFLKEYKKSIEWVNSNQAEAGKLVEKNGVGIKSKVAELAIPRCNIRYEDAKTAKSKIESFFKIILEYSPKDIGGKIPDEGFYYKK
ncbi:MAG: ABC transporter substrate-binding protein [Deltaproteobacteria bacterium]